MTVRVATSACRMVRLCDERECSDGLLGLLVNTEVRSTGGSETLCLLPFWSPVQQGFDIASLFSPALWKCPLMNFLCGFFFFVLFESVGEYYGNRRQAWQERWPLFDPQARNALLIQSGHKQLWWGSWNYSRIVFFSYSNVHILFKSKILFFRATEVQCQNLRCIVSYCLWVKKENRKESNIEL